MRVAALCGGVGAARLLPGLAALLPPRLLTAIVNVGDDCTSSTPALDPMGPRALRCYHPLTPGPSSSAAPGVQA